MFEEYDMDELSEMKKKVNEMIILGAKAVNDILAVWKIGKFWDGQN